MTLDDFKASLDGDAPPEGLDGALQALWHDAKGSWDTAHRHAQSQRDADGAWVHAYLHRVEGDLSNAAYWYHQADRPVADGDTAAEWKAIVAALL